MKRKSQYRRRSKRIVANLKGPLKGRSQYRRMNKKVDVKTHPKAKKSKKSKISEV